LLDFPSFGRISYLVFRGLEFGVLQLPPPFIEASLRFFPHSPGRWTSPKVLPETGFVGLSLFKLVPSALRQGGLASCFFFFFDESGLSPKIPAIVPFHSDERELGLSFPLFLYKSFRSHPPFPPFFGANLYCLVRSHSTPSVSRSIKTHPPQPPPWPETLHPPSSSTFSCQPLHPGSEWTSSCKSKIRFIS